MPRNESNKQINFVIAKDLEDKLGQCKNKTAVINEALRYYFENQLHTLSVIERIERIEATLKGCF